MEGVDRFLEPMLAFCTLQTTCLRNCVSYSGLGPCTAITNQDTLPQSRPLTNLICKFPQTGLPVEMSLGHAKLSVKTTSNSRIHLWHVLHACLRHTSAAETLTQFSCPCVVLEHLGSLSNLEMCFSRKVDVLNVSTAKSSERKWENCVLVTVREHI